MSWFSMTSRLPLLLCLIMAFTELDKKAEAFELCDSDIRAATQTPNGYRLRGDRCEGLFIQEIAGDSLRIVSFTKRYQDFDPSSIKQLVVKWKAPNGTPVRLRATGLRRRLYYRMDTILPIGKFSYNWPTDILNSLSLKKNDLGVLSWIKYISAGMDQQLYLPVSIDARASPGFKDSYELIIMPGVELEEVYISLAMVGPMGHSLTYIMEGKPLGYYYYPPERPIRIPVANPKSPGVYRLQIGANLAKGGSANSKILFYHPGE